MAKGASKSVVEGLECREDVGEYRRVADRGMASVGAGRAAGTGDPDQAAPLGERRSSSSVRRYFQPCHDPGFLLMAWERVAGNKGGRSAGVDGMTAAFVGDRIGVECFLADLREQLKS